MFSKEQIIEELAKGDDNRSHMLLLDLSGDFRAIPTDNCEGYEYIGSIASVDFGDGYLGEEASQDLTWVERCFTEAKEVWNRYKETGRTYKLEGIEPKTFKIR
jgi:hypothetical protein